MISLANVSVQIDGNVILDRVNFLMKGGEFVYLVGPTGAGKTTLMRLLYLDLFPTEGIVKVAGNTTEDLKKKEIPFLRRSLGIVFQDFRLFDDRDVYDNVAFALYVTNAKSKDLKKQVLFALAEVGLSHKKHQSIRELSGGEQQRVAIARALVNSPFLLLADEPTGNLDPATSAEILELLRKINMRGTAVLMATHNYDIVRKYPARIVQVTNGQLKEVGSKM